MIACVMNFDHLRSRFLRDLAWLLYQPPLLHSLGEDSDYLDIELVDEGTPIWLAQADQSSITDSFIPQKRIGLYAEQLLAFYFEHYERFTLIKKNLQIFDDKNKKTLGEIDFIVIDHKTDTTIHIECALKFYLGYLTNPEFILNNLERKDWHHWIGPNQKDTLSIKLSHLLNHQLSISQTPEAIRTFSSNNIDATKIQRRLLLKGHFYLPLSENISLPTFANNTQPYRYWTTLKDINRLVIKGNFEYSILPRALWISSISYADKQDIQLETKTAKDFTDTIREYQRKGENYWQVIKWDTKNRKEQQRFFVINND